MKTMEMMRYYYNVIKSLRKDDMKKDKIFVQWEKKDLNIMLYLKEKLGFMFLNK